MTVSSEIALSGPCGCTQSEHGTESDGAWLEACPMTAMELASSTSASITLIMMFELRFNLKIRVLCVHGAIYTMVSP
jgi:hypothetical protein